MEPERTLDTTDSIEELIATAQRLIDRHPALAPLLPRLLDEIETRENIYEADALACLRFHYEHPVMAELLMHMAAIVKEDAGGERQYLDDEVWTDEPTMPG